MTNLTRYAVYFAPETNSPWWAAGCRWLGRDPEIGAELARPTLNGITPNEFDLLTNNARRYGFHATLKAPFKLASGSTESTLLELATQFCERTWAVPLGVLVVKKLGNFLTLHTNEARQPVMELAQSCVSYFDELRAPMTAIEPQARRRSNLSTRQKALLERWGYPFTEDEYRFHMTLTDSLAALDQAKILALSQAAEAWFSINKPLTLNHLCLFKEETPGAPLMLLRRFELKTLS